MLARAPGDDTLDALAAALDDPEPGVRRGRGSRPRRPRCGPSRARRAREGDDRRTPRRGRPEPRRRPRRVGPRGPATTRRPACAPAWPIRTRRCARPPSGRCAADPPDVDGLVAALHDPAYRGPARRRRGARGAAGLAGRAWRRSCTVPMRRSRRPRSARWSGTAPEVREVLVAWADAKVDRAMALAAARATVEVAPPTSGRRRSWSTSSRQRA